MSQRKPPPSAEKAIPKIMVKITDRKVTLSSVLENKNQGIRKKATATEKKAPTKKRVMPLGSGSTIGYRRSTAEGDKDGAGKSSPLSRYSY